MTSDAPERSEGAEARRGGEERPRRGGGGGGRRGARRRGCEFCQMKAEIIDYKDTDLLKRYVTDRGKIESRRKVGTCAKHQRVLSTAVKRARHVALLPYTAEHVRVTGINMGRR